MCVLPPSVHPTTNKVYRWLGGLEPWAMPLGDVPAAVLAYFAETRRNGRAEPVADVIPKGKRDDTLASLAGTMRRRGMGENEILAALQAVNRERCKPPLNERDIKRIARSVASKKPEQRERDDKPFELSVQTARGICALPDPPWSDELLGPLVVRGQRLILGGHTGEGKTTAMLQIIRAIVLGESFLDWQGSSGRALVIDAEQGLKTIKRRLREAGLGDSDLVDYVRVPDGLELDSDERHIAEVERVLEAGGYALVAADPLYKLHAGDSNAEREAVDLMRRFDAWRERLRFALLLPVHCRKPVPGTKFSIHDLFGSSAYVRGAEVVLGLQRVSDGYARLHFLKDRDGDLPISTAWGLLFNREEGFRRDPDDGKTRDIRAELLEALADSEWRTVTELRRKEEDGGIGADPKTIRPVLDALTDEEQLEYCIGPAGKPRNAKCWRVPSSAPNDGDDGTLFSGHSGDPGGAAVVPSSPYIGDGDDDDGTDTAPASPRAVVNPHDGTLT